jgi:hypothetical protein
MARSLEFERASTYRLLDNGMEVGRLVGNTLVVSGFANTGEAERAADAGYAALLRLLAYHRATAVHRPPPMHIPVNEDRSAEWIEPMRESLARIVDPGNHESVSVEFTLLRDPDTTVATSAAMYVYQSIMEARRDARRRRTSNHLSRQEL